jgi:hypothetical protein
MASFDRLKTRPWFFIVMSALLFLAMVSRITADLAPRARVIHLLGTAICWLIASLILRIRVVPKVRISEEE